MGVMRLPFPRRRAEGRPPLLAAAAALALFLGVSPASGVADDQVIEEAKVYGDPEFYVKLKGVEVSEGELDPPFTANREQYTLVIENPYAKELLFSMELNIEKYDLMFTPKIELNGVKVHYSPIGSITGVAWLNKSIGALDQVMEITLSDPKPATGFFVGPGACKTYKIRVLQPPEYDKIVEATNITVEDAHTKELIVSRPPFDSESSKVNYVYVVNESTEAVDLKVQCHKESTGLMINGDAAGSKERILIKGDRHVVLVQCVYSDHRWTHDHVLQRTYVLTFSRTASLDYTEAEVKMQSNQGFCLQNDKKNMSKGWTCRSVREHPFLVGMYNNTKAGLLLIDKSSKGEFRLANGLPIKVPNPETHDGEYELVMKAGANTRRFDVTVMRPAECTEVQCPRGTVKKSELSESAYDHLCLGRTCDQKKDAEHCCEEGTPHDVIVTSWGSTTVALAKAIEKATGYSREEAIAVYTYADTPAILVSGVTGSVAESQAYMVRKGGAEARTKRTPAASYGVGLAASHGHDKKALIKALAGAGKSPEDTKALVEAGGGTIKAGLDKPASEKLLGALKTKQLADAGGEVFIIEVAPRMDIWVDSFSPKLKEEDRDKVIQAIMDVTGLPLSSATKAVDKIPNFVAGGLTPADSTLLMALLEKHGAKEKELPHGHNHLPYYLKGACKDPNSPMCGSTASCSKVTCPAGKLNVLNGTCKSSECTDADVDKCCGTAVLCSDYSCPMHWGKKLQPWGTKCAIQDVMQVCCEKSAMCDSFVCPAGYVLHDHASSTSCEDATCDKFGKDICCSQVSVCSAFRCPDAMVPKKDAAKIFVEPLSAEACCDQRETCEKFECSKGLARKMDASLILCRGAKCNDTDVGACCEGAGTCFGFPYCPPHTTVVPNPGTTNCKAQHCTPSDIPTCCKKVPTCSSFQCPVRYTLRQNADFIDCLGLKCTSLDMRRCCEPQAVCGSMTCPVHYGLIPHQADFTFCHGARCTEADTDTCCSEQTLCKSFKLPDKFVFKAVADGMWVNRWDKDKCWAEAATCQDFYGCPGGFKLRKKAWSILCTGEVCSDVDTGSCCEKDVVHREQRPFTVSVTDEDTNKECPHSTGQSTFWCKSDADKVNLQVRYKAQGKEAIIKPLTAIPVPDCRDGPKHITVILREPFIETTRLSIWVYQGDWSRESEVDVTSRRLAEGNFSDSLSGGGRTIMYEFGEGSGQESREDNALPLIWS